MNIQEFARQIGVSTATVSRALHKRGRISPATRQMILERAKELGYTPNLHAQRLVTGRSHMIALDYLGQAQILSDMFLVALARGIQQALQAHGYGLLLNLMVDPQQHDTLQRQWVRSQAVDGLILVGGAEVDRAMLREVAAGDTPCVLISQQPVEGVAHVGSVAVGLAHGARQVARMLVEQGHRCIGFLGSELPDPVLAAFRVELQTLGAGLSEARVTIAGRTPEEGAQAMRQMLARRRRPTAVFARTDALALGALRAAKQLSLRVPEDLSLVGHDDIAAAEWTDPPLTTVRVDCLELGQAATRMLVQLLKQPEIRPDPCEVHTELVQRASVAAPGGR